MLVRRGGVWLYARTSPCNATRPHAASPPYRDGGLRFPPIPVIIASRQNTRYSPPALDAGRLVAIALLFCCQLYRKAAFPLGAASRPGQRQVCRKGTRGCYQRATRRRG